MVEILVVIGIIGLLLSISIPSLTSYSQGVRLRTTVRQALGLFSLARTLAIGSRENKTVLVDKGNRRIVIEDTMDDPEPKSVKLPNGIDVKVERFGGQVESETYSKIIFESNGALKGSSATLTFSSSGRSQSLRVTSATGAISIE
jgi:Tfp pilus assembly protein FimT